MVDYKYEGAKGYIALSGIPDGEDIAGVIKIAGKRNPISIDGLFTPFFYEKSSNHFYCDTKKLWFCGKKELLQHQYSNGLPPELRAELEKLPLNEQEHIPISIEKLRLSTNSLGLANLVMELFEIKFEEINQNVVLVHDNNTRGYIASISRVFANVPKDVMMRAKASKQYYSLINSHDKRNVTSIIKFKPKLVKKSNKIPKWLVGKEL